MNRRNRLGWLTWMLLGLSVSLIQAAETSRLLHLRAADHATFTRVVAEFERIPQYELSRVETHEITMRFYATTLAPQLRVRALETSGLISEATASTPGTGVLLLSLKLTRPVRIREFSLDDPPRLVFDLLPTSASPPEEAKPEDSTKPATNVESDKPDPPPSQETQRPSGKSNAGDLGLASESQPSSRQPTAVGMALASTGETSANSTPFKSSGGNAQDDQNDAKRASSHNRTLSRGLLFLSLLINLLLLVGVGHLLWQNRRLRTQIRFLQPDFAAVSTQPSPRRVLSPYQAIRQIYTRWVHPRTRRWLRRHYQDVLFFVTLAVVLLLLMLALRLS